MAQMSFPDTMQQMAAIVVLLTAVLELVKVLLEIRNVNKAKYKRRSFPPRRRRR